MVSKSTKPNAKNPQGGIVKQEAPIHISNLNPVDPKTGKADTCREEEKVLMVEHLFVMLKNQERRLNNE